MTRQFCRTERATYEQTIHPWRAESVWPETALSSVALMHGMSWLASGLLVLAIGKRPKNYPSSWNSSFSFPCIYAGKCYIPWISNGCNIWFYELVSFPYLSFIAYLNQGFFSTPKLKKHTHAHTHSQRAKNKVETPNRPFPCISPTWPRNFPYWNADDTCVTPL